MDIIEILNYCNANQIKIFVDDGKLKIKSAQAVKEPRLIGGIKAHKADLIALLSEKDSSDEVVKVTDDRHLPLSYAQQRLFLLHKMEPQSGAYNMPSQIEMNGRLDRQCFEQAIRALAERHDVLRTTFQTVEDEVFACVQRDRLPQTRFEDLSDLADEVQMVEVERRGREAALQAFDLQQELPMRITVLQLAPDRAILLFTLPHIVSDGWSMGVLVQDFCRLYSGFCSGQAQMLPPLDYQYADYAHWQKRWLSSEHLQRSLAYWRGTLRDLPSCHSLPMIFDGREKKTTLSEKLTFRLEPSLCDSIATFCRQHDVTLFIFLQTVFALLVSRYGNDTDTVVGFPISGREDERFFGNIGCFVNTLLIRTEVDPDESFVALLSRNRATIVEAYEHQSVPFDMLVEALNPSRSWQCNPLFQILFTLHNNEQAATVLPGLELTRRENQATPSKMDLEVSATEVDGAIHFDWLYNPNLFESYVMLGMLESYRTLIGQVLANPERSVWQLPLLAPKAEAEMLLAGRGPVTEPAELTLAQLFEAQCERSPEAVAVIFEDKEISYRQLNAAANRLALRLRSEVDIAPDMAIGLYCHRSVEMLIGLLGIVKAGAAYLPLDPGYPSQRIAYMLTHSEVTLVLTTPQLVSALPAESTAGRLILDECVSQEVSTVGDCPNPVPCRADDLAYIIYTSGSTGAPKGVMIPHRAVVNFLLSMQKSPGFTDRDSLLAVTPISFDISVLELFLPICSGGRVVICPEAVSRNAQLLSALLIRHQISVMQATPATWKLLQQSPDWLSHNKLKVLCGGEAIGRELATDLCENMAEVWNMYGPTETTVWSSAGAITRPDMPMTIGQPIDNTTLYILNEQRQLAPAGVCGELYIGGEGLSRGYYQRADLTEERFVDNPFASGKEATLYRTGDMAKRNAQGEIQILGRSDNQVKIRGYRIELEEIESALRSHEWVKDAALRCSSHHEGMLVACVVPAAAAGELPVESPEEVSDALRTHVSLSLPDYMVPQQYLFIEALPLTPNGKIDRKALPDVSQQLVCAARYVAGRNSKEKHLCRIWQQVLGCEQVGVYDNFFSLGGNSLSLFRLFNEMNKAGFNYTLEDLFKCQTIDALENKTHLATDVRSIGVPVSSIVVKLNDASSERKVFCIHPEGGIATCYSALAGMMASEAAFYGLQAPPIFGVTLIASIDNLADYYVGEILRHQPEGGYSLLGWSLGGSIAWQVAVRLKALGHRIDYLGVFDSELPLVAAADEQEALAWEALVSNFRADGLTLDKQTLLSLTPPERKAYLLEQIENGGIRPEGISDEMTRCYLDYLIDVKHSKYATCLTRSDIDIDYYAIENSLYTDSGPLRGWADISSGEVALLPAKGSHLTMLQPPFATSLVETLRARMGEGKAHR